MFDDEQFDKSASSSECTKRALHSVERSIYKGYKCCFLKKTCKEDGETDTVQYCYPLTQTEYNNIDKIKSEGKKAGCSEVTVDCKSSYLNLALASLILILL